MENKWTEASTHPDVEGDYLVFVSWYQGYSDKPRSDVRILSYYEGKWKVGWRTAEREELYVTYWMPIPDTSKLTIPEFLEYV